MHLPSLGDFDLLYAGKISTDLAEADRVRKKILLNYCILGFVLFGGFVVEAITWMLAAITVIIIFVVVYVRWFGIPFSRFETLYQRAIIQNTVQFISSSFTVDYNSHLKLSELQEALIISGNPPYFGGSYLVHGKVNGADMRISEIVSTAKKMKDSGGDAVFRYFKGVVAVHKAPTGLKGNVLVCSGNMLTEQYDAFSDKINIRHDADDALVIYAGGDEDYKSQLPGELLKQFKSYISESGNQVIFSLYPEGMAVAIMHPPGFAYLNPSVFRSAFTKQAAEIYYRDMLFLTQTIAMASKRAGYTTAG